ncbi:MAG: hypothetical protein N2595_09605 [bacterium]|nr:hypothetical protein [bacterium]
MIAFFNYFFRRRFVQYRQSVHSGGVHTAPPVWAHSMPNLLPPFERVLPDGSVELCSTLSVSECGADFTAPTPERRYYVRFPYLGAFTWYELANQAHALPADNITLVVLTDAVHGWEGYDQRLAISADLLVLFPIDKATPAAQQSAALGTLPGHLREAAHNANASLRGGVELPFFTNASEENELPNELICLRYRLTIKETILKSINYGLQV